MLSVEEVLGPFLGVCGGRATLADATALGVGRPQLVVIGHTGELTLHAGEPLLRRRGVVIREDAGLAKMLSEIAPGQSLLIQLTRRRSTRALQMADLALEVGPGPRGGYRVQTVKNRYVECGEDRLLRVPPPVEQPARTQSLTEALTSPRGPRRL